jgi:hypothetical protein
MRVPRAGSEIGYYGMPLPKRPSWKNGIPLYFFVGGAAGAAAIMAGVAKLTGADPRLTRDARYLAAIGGSVSPALLIADLGMPSRFSTCCAFSRFKARGSKSPVIERIISSSSRIFLAGTVPAPSFLIFASQDVRILSSRSAAVIVKPLPFASQRRFDRIGIVVLRSTTPAARRDTQAPRTANLPAD